MPKSKDKTNWSYIAMGLALCLAFVWVDKTAVQKNEVETLTIIVSHDIQKVGNRKSRYEFRLSAKEYPCSFMIPKAGGMAAHWDNLDNTTTNDTLVIGIRSSRVEDLTNKVKDIPIYSLNKNNQQVYTLDTYNASQAVLDRRWNTIFVFLGSLLLIRGFALLSSKITAIIAAIGALTITTLRLLDIWW